MIDSMIARGRQTNKRIEATINEREREAERRKERVEVDRCWRMLQEEQNGREADR